MQVYYGQSQREIVPDYLFKAVGLASKRKKNIEVTFEDEGDQGESEPVPPQPTPEVDQPQPTPEVEQAPIQASEVEVVQPVPEVDSSPVPAPEPVQATPIIAEPEPVQAAPIVPEPEPVQATPIVSQPDPEVEARREAEERAALEKAERQRQRERAEGERKQKEADEKERLKEQKKKEDREKKEKQAALLKERQERAAKEISERKEQGGKPGSKQVARMQFDFEEEEASAGGQESDSESLSQSKDSVPRGSASGRGPAAKPRRKSIKYEEEEEEAGEVEEEGASGEALHIVNPLDTPLDGSRTRREVTEAAEKRRAGWATGLFAATLFGSLALWAVLFRALMMQNAGLGEAVLEVPTLGQYHGKYSDFYASYNAGTDEMIRARGLVSGPATPARASLFALFGQREAVARAVARLRDGLASAGRGRVLATAADRESLSQAAKTLQEQLAEFRKSVAGLSEAQRLYVRHFDEVVEAVRKMYRDSLDMIDLYGEFFYMTHRIWVATENIFRLFERRAVQVNSEMAVDHYEPHSTSASRLFLGRTAFALLSRVSEAPAISVQADRPATLVCSTSAEIDNEDFASLERAFELKLLVDGRRVDAESPFKYQVGAKRDRLSFVQALEIAPGTSTIHLYAKVEKGDVKLENFTSTCVKLTDYAKWPELVDFRLT